MSASRCAILVGDGLEKNNIFDLKNLGNRDGCHEPFLTLKNMFLRRGIDLNTPDCSSGVPAFELHLNVRRAKTPAIPAYLLLLENSLILPDNASIPAYYKRVFTWNDDLVDGKRHIKINLPNPIKIPVVDGFKNRDRFCCIIAGNKTTEISDPLELYSERVHVIRWFERHALQDFDLYGLNWDLPAARRGLPGKLQKVIVRHLPKHHQNRYFPSYRGKIDSKASVLRRTRFSFCYENVRDVPGYITEKLFDCLFSGCVPVYWGANNIGNYVPSGCYIDRREFNSTEAVYLYLKNLKESEYCEYQERIARFLASSEAKQFDSSMFAETVSSMIIADYDGE